MIAITRIDMMWILPSAMTVNVTRVIQALVNGGSNYDSFGSQMPRRVIFDVHEWINEVLTVPGRIFAKQQIG